MNVIKNNPTRLSTLAAAVIGLLTAYKVKGVSADQAVAIMAVVAALSNEFVRSAVSPVATPDPTPAAAEKALATADALRALANPAPVAAVPAEVQTAA